MDELERMLLEQIADLHKVPDGAYNIRKNGEPYLHVFGERNAAHPH